MAGSVSDDGDDDGAVTHECFYGFLVLFHACTEIKKGSDSIIVVT